MTEDELRRTYAGRRVLVTGHTGFKGSWLALWLRRLDAVVTGYALAPPTAPSNFELSCVATDLTAAYTADIRDRASLLKALRASRPEVVFHLAAQALVRASYQQPYETFEVNAMGTAAVLEAVREWGQPCAVVVVTTDKCYENRDHVEAYQEDDPLGGHDPYSASKGAAEIIVASYRRSFFPPAQLARHGVRIASARAGNVIGGGDWATDRIVTDIIAHLARREPVPVRNPQAVRPWQHVLEPLSGYLTLGARLLGPQPEACCCAWNFGPEITGCVPVQELVECFCRAWGGGTWISTATPGQPHEAHVLRLCIDKARRELGWQPRWALEEAVVRTVDWQKEHLANPGACTRAACLRDIDAYMAAGSSTAGMPAGHAAPR